MPFDFITEAGAWGQALAPLADAGGDDVYFSHAYAALSCGRDGEPMLFAGRDGGCNFAFPVIRRPIGASGDFDFETPYGYGGPLAGTEDAGALAQFWRAFREACSAMRIIAGFVRFHPLLDTHKAVPGGVMQTRHDRDTVFVDLRASEDMLWSGYAGRARTDVRKAQKRGVDVAVSDDMDAFAGLYRARMQELGADESYFFDDAYFAAVQALGSESRRLYLARAGGETIGGALVLLSPRFAHYHLAASPKAHQSLSPAASLCDAMIRDLAASGCEALHLGGGRTAAADDALFRFKAGFSKGRKPFHTGAAVIDTESYEQHCAAWRASHPDKTARYGGRVLCYRCV